MDIDALPVAGTPSDSTEKLHPLPPFVKEVWESPLAPSPSPAPSPPAGPLMVPFTAALRFTAQVLRDAADLAEARGLGEWIDKAPGRTGTFTFGVGGGDVAGPDGKPFDPGHERF